MQGELSAGTTVAILVSILGVALAGAWVWALRTRLWRRDQELIQELRRHAWRDALTGLTNRAAFNDTLSAWVAEHHPPSSGVGLLLVDLDRFKTVNDTWGHSYGDALLALIAGRLESVMPDGGCLARVGGDEFAMLLRQVDVQTALALAERVVAEVAVPADLGGVTVSAELSIGVAHAPTDGSTGESLLRGADLATYAAKTSSSSVCRYRPDMLESTGESLQLAMELPSALDAGELTLWFQPIVNLQTLEIVGVEGLVRWVHPRLGVLTPDRFLHLLELSRDQHRFATMTIEQAIRLVAGAREQGHELFVTVNLGPSSFLDTGLPALISALLATYDVPASQLILELTEQHALGEAGREQAVFAEIARLGVLMAVDDFGTGYSSLDRLRRMPLRLLKIDKSFVTRSGRHAEDHIIVRTVTELAHLLHLEVVAEGVESPEELERLRSVGCGFGQGWLFAPALRNDDLYTLLDAKIDLASVERVRQPASSAGAPAFSALWVSSAERELGTALVDDHVYDELGLQLCERLPFPVFLKSRDGRFVWSNQWHTDHVAEVDSIIDARDIDVHEPAEALQYRQDDLHVINEGVPIVDRIERQERRNGTVVDLRTTKVPINNEAGEVIGLFGYSFELGTVVDGQLQVVASAEPDHPLLASSG